MDGAGRLVVDYDKSGAFVMVDHEIGFLYAKEKSVAEAVRVLEGLEGVGRVETGQNGILKSERAGQGVIVTEAGAWLVHDWWENDEEKPAWQFGVDIHNKPGFDPRELFFGPAKKCIAQDPRLVKGSHGRADKRAVILSDRALPGNIEATEVAGILEAELGA
jgi:hypothetical protein